MPGERLILSGLLVPLEWRAYFFLTSFFFWGRLFFFGCSRLELPRISTKNRVFA